MQNQQYDNIDQNTTEGRNIIIKMNEKLIILFNLAFYQNYKYYSILFYFLYSYYDFFYLISVLFNLSGIHRF